MIPCKEGIDRVVADAIDLGIGPIGLDSQDRLHLAEGLTHFDKLISS